LPASEDAKNLPLTFTTYKVAVQQVVIGDVAVSQAIRIAIADHLGIEGAEALNGALLFLTPATTDLFNVSNLPRGESIYIVVGGRLGVVPNANAGTVSAVQRYVSRADGPVDSVGWAARHLKNTDSFLQRSAIMDLYLQHDRSGAFNLLSEAVRAEAIHESNRGLAIEALEATGKAQAKAPLKALAEDASQSTPLREQAVEALSTLPGAEGQISQWRSSNDALLSEAADRVAAKERGPN
jgi:hypothetical protein